MPLKSTETSAPRAAAAPRRRRDGEITRKRILDATLRLIDRHGVHTLTHRAVAAEAEVPLASTTYFFASLSALVREAFAHYCALAQPSNAAVLAQALGVVQHAQQQGWTRARLRESIESLLLAFIDQELRERELGLSVEAQFLNLVHPEPLLAEAMAHYRASLVQNMAQVLQALGSPHPEADASLLLGVIHRMELDGLAPAQAQDAAQRQTELRRMLNLLFPDAAA